MKNPALMKRNRPILKAKFGKSFAPPHAIAGNRCRAIRQEVPKSASVTKRNPL